MLIKRMEALVLFDYKPNQNASDEIEVKKGDVVKITPFNKDWNIASFSDRKGFLPTNYVKHLNESLPTKDKYNSTTIIFYAAIVLAVLILLILLGVLLKKISKKKVNNKHSSIQNSNQSQHFIEMHTLNEVYKPTTEVVKRNRIYNSVFELETRLSLIFNIENNKFWCKICGLKVAKEKRLDHIEDYHENLDESLIEADYLFKLIKNN